MHMMAYTVQLTVNVVVRLFMEMMASVLHLVAN